MLVFFFFQAKKDSEFADVRTTTDFCEEALQTALTQVKEVRHLRHQLVQVELIWVEMIRRYLVRLKRSGATELRHQITHTCIRRITDHFPRVSAAKINEG